MSTGGGDDYDYGDGDAARPVGDTSWRRPAMTAESHRVTSFEIFFDLVFVFAITRVVSFMARSLTAATLAQGLILLLLLWWSWAAYVWLGNRVRTDRGVVRAGMLVVMAALFLAALVMPDAWSRRTGTVDAPLILAAAFIVVRLVYFGLYLTAAAEDSRLRVQLLADAVPQTLSLAPLIAGALLAGAWQTALWAVAFAIDFGGGRIASRVGGWQVRSPGHFAERHRMVLITVLGESLISAGAGAGDSVSRSVVLVAAALGFAAVVCLWWLYFEPLAAAAEEALEHASPARRARIARDAYTMVHFLLVAGVLYLALGAREVLAAVTDSGASNLGAPLTWPASTALCAGTAVYLAGRAAFAGLTVRQVSRAQLAAAAALLVLLPVARHLPALAELAAVTVTLGAVAVSSFHNDCHVR
ncbi:low temperature requirement protein A [Streptomyces sp. MBT53]|uniref:low temperature requirement protein A n=1 Tax=Streptomyces sp. MBT53 TaxID=1488384 RepID=UPI001913EDFF|nr:low temperature requirement protein A [Streptomyces sp. MBT53]MBK6016127.1 low temperature requirement protein A [Streptomyces sp. MBT53]